MLIRLTNMRVCLVAAASIGSTALGGAADVLMNAILGDEDTASGWEAGGNAFGAASYASRHNHRNGLWVSGAQPHYELPLLLSLIRTR